MREAVSFLEAGDLGFAISRYDDGCIHSCVDASLEQERHIVNHDGLGIVARDGSGLTDLLAGNAGVDDAFELPAFFWIAGIGGAPR